MTSSPGGGRHGASGHRLVSRRSALGSGERCMAHIRELVAEECRLQPACRPRSRERSSARGALPIETAPAIREWRASVRNPARRVNCSELGTLRPHAIAPIRVRMSWQGTDHPASTSEACGSMSLRPAVSMSVSIPEVRLRLLSELANSPEYPSTAKAPVAYSAAMHHEAVIGGVARRTEASDGNGSML